ncbi:hypothetical protein [Evansella halocellulosilytica]|uniref:hypothetical protein n=1 Tax=Evansella halocellulosilytica TaxID=2011013 RepID=UPI000BB67FFB|nr:hypothetical protein [Evansella halocellulosilytica]
MSFALSGFMLYTMWVVLAAIGVNFLLGIINSFRQNTFALSNLAEFLNGILYSVFPLFILVNLMTLDPTSWLFLTAYYIGAVGVIFKYLYEIQEKL